MTVQIAALFLAERLGSSLWSKVLVTGANGHVGAR
jgi:hypothetical protein